MKLKNILDEMYIGQINEANLSRLLSKVNNNMFCIATAWRSSNTKKQNILLNRELAASLNTKKMGGYNLIGHWQEAPDGTDYETADPESLSDSVEDSILFIKSDEMSESDFVEFCTNIAKKYNQDAVLIKTSEGISLLFKSGQMDKIASSISLNKIGQAFSQMRKKPNVPFIFEGLLSPTGNLGKQTFQRMNLKY